MAVNLINMLQQEFSGDAIGKIGSFLGETPANTQSALGYALPVILGMAAQKTQTSQGAADLFGMLQRGNFDGSAFGSLGSLLKAGSGAADLVKTGTPLVSSLFGDRRTGLTDLVASSAGVRPQSAASLLGFAAPLVLNMVGRQASSAGGFNASSVAALLGGQKEFLRSVLPAGLASVVGFTGWDEPVRTDNAVRAYEAPREPARVETARVYNQPISKEPVRDHDRPGGMGWLKWAPPLLLLPLLFWAFSGRNREPIPDAIGTGGTAATVKHRLTCGQELDVAPNGVEARLVSFIDDATRGADKEVWVTFDRLEFETGSATLRASSEAQLRNVAEILRCYPNVHLKIGGYTDNVGDPASNLKLSQARAETTRRAVITHGIDESRLEAEGYGEQHPVASNDTDAGRQRNRRIDVRVTQK